jgi:hypothetical protein
LRQWTKEGQVKVAWLKLNLSLEQLFETLRDIHPTEAEIRFSVIGEFQEDYTLFLKELRHQILQNFGIENVERILEDFFCVKIDRLGETLKLLEIYYGLLNEFFPAFLKLKDSPLKISIVCSNVKFPFFEVWRIVEKPQEDIFVSLIGRGTMQGKITALESIVKATKAQYQYRKSSLYKLAKLAETSETLAKLAFQDRRDRKDYPTYSQLDKNLPQLDFPSIFTFAKLIGD